MALPLPDHRARKVTGRDSPGILPGITAGGYMSAVTEDPPVSSRATLGALTAAFLAVSLFGFGGGIVWARRIVVERRHWLDEHEFLDIVSLTQFLPGPNIVGIAVCVGAKLRGGVGAMSAIAGFLVIPWSVGLAVGIVCLEYARTPLLGNVLGGVSAAAAGLIFATGVRLLLPQRHRPVALAVAALAFAMLAIAKLSLVAVICILVPASIVSSALLPADGR